MSFGVGCDYCSSKCAGVFRLRVARCERSMSLAGHLGVKAGWSPLHNEHLWISLWHSEVG